MHQYSDRDRGGAFANPPRPGRWWRRRRRKALPLGASLVIAFVVGAGAATAYDLLARTESLSSIAVDLSSYIPWVSQDPATAREPTGSRPRAIPLCPTFFGGLGTCIVDGDTGWESGVKWRLHDVDTPEVSQARCRNERNQGIAARDRLQDLMRAGYTIDWLGRTDRYGRQLVRVRLGDGADAGRVLLREGLARSWPDGAKTWCNGR